MHTRDYTTAAVDLIHAGGSVDMVLSGLKKVLADHGDLKLLPTVLQAIHDSLESEEGHVGTVVKVRSAADAEAFKKEIEHACGELDVSNEFLLKEDETLVGGFSVSTEERVVDNTYKTKLINLYRELTH